MKRKISSHATNQLNISATNDPSKITYFDKIKKHRLFKKIFFFISTNKVIASTSVTSDNITNLDIIKMNNETPEINLNPNTPGSPVETKKSSTRPNPPETTNLTMHNEQNIIRPTNQSMGFDSHSNATNRTGEIDEYLTRVDNRTEENIIGLLNQSTEFDSNLNAINRTDQSDVIGFPTKVENQTGENIIASTNQSMEFDLKFNASNRTDESDLNEYPTKVLDRIEENISPINKGKNDRNMKSKQVFLQDFDLLKIQIPTEEHWIHQAKRL